VDETPSALPLNQDAPPGVVPLSPGLDAPSGVVSTIITLPRWFAALQVLLVCGIPTQLLIATALIMAGVRPLDGSHWSLEFFATLSLFDTALIALLIRFFLILSGETSNDVFIGRRPVGGEIGRGLLLLPVVFVGVLGVVTGLRAVLPWLHNVQQSPLEAFMDTPLDAAIFGFVVVLAGGVREELARGFILHRFEQRLGGAWLGLTIFSMTFAALHLDQGFDAALAVGLLGVLWGVLYIRRGSVVAPMVNHAGFDAAQVLQVVLARMLS
jgi:membrane protease YdiL (CAAX protease family)